MGRFVNPAGCRWLAWTVAGVIAVLNVWLLYQTVVSLVESSRPCTGASSWPIENSPADRTILEHVSALARLTRRDAGAGARGGWLGGAQLRPAAAARIRGDERRPRVPRRTCSAISSARGHSLSKRGWRAGDPARELIRAASEARRSHRDVNARPSVSDGPDPRHHRRPRAAPGEGAGAAAEGEIAAYYARYSAKLLGVSHTRTASDGEALVPRHVEDQLARCARPSDCSRA